VYEHRKQQLLPPRQFGLRVARHGGYVILLFGSALTLGVVGYHLFGGLAWIDSLLNASMILGGMGPVDPMRTTAGKLFSSFYALFSGVVFIAASGVLLAPFLHRLVHRFHLESADK
jgi:hypothetical protein